MTALLGSSMFIVLAVVPISLLISTMAAFAIGLLKIPGSRVLLFLFVFGLTLPFTGVYRPALLLGTCHRHLQHAVGDCAAVDRLVYAVRGVLDARSLRRCPR